MVSISTPKYLLLSFALVVSVVSGFNGKKSSNVALSYSRHHQHLNHESNILNMNTRESEAGEVKLSDIESNSPGFSGSFPISTSGAARIELGRILLSMAVFWLTLKIKINEVVDKSMGSKSVENASNVESISNPFAIVELEEGIKIQDRTLGSTIPNPGDIVMLETKAYHNGLELFDGEVFQFKFPYGVEGPLLRAMFPPYLSGLAVAVGGMKLGGARQVALPCEDGFEPYVPKGGVILCETTLRLK